MVHSKTILGLVATFLCLFILPGCSFLGRGQDKEASAVPVNPPAAVPTKQAPLDWKTTSPQTGDPLPAAPELSNSQSDNEVDKALAELAESEAKKRLSARKRPHASSSVATPSR